MVSHRLAQPRRWTSEELTHDSSVALERFVATREGPKAYARHFQTCLAGVKRLFAATNDLADFGGPALAKEPELVGMARFLGGPPISEDDLETLVGGGIGKTLSRELAAKIAGVLKAAWDPLRFPWVTAGRNATTHEVAAASNWTASICAIEKTRTELRNEPAKKQQNAVSDALLSYGYKEAPRPIGRHIVSLDNIERGSFVRNGWLADKDCDIAVRLRDGRLLAIECKVSNSSVNSVKRLINDAGGKADIWRRAFGEQVVASAVLAGVFKLVNLVEAQDKHHVFLVWEHDMAPLRAFLDEAK